jgi:hypothetical protein
VLIGKLILRVRRRRGPLLHLIELVFFSIYFWQGAIDLPPKKWTGLGRQLLGESWAEITQSRV